MCIRDRYNTAQAGATAATSGARDLQNYQTEEQIRQIQKNLNDTYESKDDMEDSLDELREQGKTASAQVASAQALSLIHIFFVLSCGQWEMRVHMVATLKKHWNGQRLSLIHI